MKLKTKDPNTGEIVEVEIDNPYRYGSIMHKEFEKDLWWLKTHDKLIERDKYGNFIVYKTSACRHVVIFLLALIVFVLFAIWSRAIR
ncbi:hypothetical protein [Enorma phocaeensis]|uniref:hypothetical protein n=1 Tax=Enorma phocaeensis TaxID=1871019 RepID=UPI00320A2B19